MTPAGEPRATLETILNASLAAVEGHAAVTRAMSAPCDPLRIGGVAIPDAAELHVLAVGKAASAMARAIEARAGSRIRSGLVITKDGHGLPLRYCSLRETAHPVPDARCEAAAQEALAQLRAAAPDDVVVLLLSGGASSLVACPVAGVSTRDLAVTTELLLASGADIAAMNCVRKHLSDIAGGRLAQASRGGRIIVLAISDVPGDDPAVIGSGPCAADPTTYREALAVLDRLALRSRVPAPVRALLEAGERGLRPETAKPGDESLARVTTRIVARSRDAVRAALGSARSHGLRAVDLGPVLAGEARVVGARLGALASALAAPQAVCLVASGETAVTVRGAGKGGRSQELALAAAHTLVGEAALLAAGTDGTDGPTDAAGAFADAGTLARGRAAGVDGARALATNDAYPFFEREGGILRTGPTSTNVMDLVLVFSPGRA